METVRSPKDWFAEMTAKYPNLSASRRWELAYASFGGEPAAPSQPELDLAAREQYARDARLLRNQARYAEEQAKERAQAEAYAAAYRAAEEAKDAARRDKHAAYKERARLRGIALRERNKASRDNLLDDTANILCGL
jgi:hypothetical protein